MMISSTVQVEIAIWVLFNSDARVVFSIADRCIAFRDGAICFSNEIQNTSYKEIQRVLRLTENKAHRMQEKYDQPDKEIVFQDLSLEHDNRKNTFRARPGEVTGVVFSQNEDYLYDLFSNPLQLNGTVCYDGSLKNIREWMKKNKKSMMCLKKRFWDHGIFPELTVAENILLPTYAKFNDRAGILNKKVLKISLSDFAKYYQINPAILNLYPRQVDISDLNKIVLWRILFFRPRLVILDEPCYAMDAATRGYFYFCIEEMKKKGT